MFSSLFEIVAALQAGRLDAAWVWGSGIDEAKQIPGVSIIEDDRNVKPAGVAFLAVRREFLERNPEVVVACLKAVAEAADWEANNLEKAAELLANRVQAPKDRVLASLQRSNPTLVLERRHLEVMDSFVEFMVTNGMLKERPMVDQYVTPEPLRKADPSRVGF
ncbi:MAG: ABC transporter substrate-binding protein, partial [Bacillota bacterium]